MAAVSWRRGTSPDSDVWPSWGVTGLISVLGPDSHSDFVPWWCLLKMNLHLFWILGHLSLHGCCFGTDTGFILKTHIENSYLKSYCKIHFRKKPREASKGRQLLYREGALSRSEECM